ncbi:MAG: tagaturonate reductase [Bacteroidota bacterium]
MLQLNRTTAQVGPPLPEKVLQIGGGNFLRAFADWMLNIYNQKCQADLGVLLVSATPRGNYQKLQEQEGLYHVLSRGFSQGQIVDEQQLVSCISRVLHLYPDWDRFLASAENPDLRFIISNTTEAGIRFMEQDQWNDHPPAEFPAKLTHWLYRRFQFFRGDHSKGCILLPTELIPQNGQHLRKCILQYIEHWELGDDFKEWILSANLFCNSLVDRIVPGVSSDALSREWEKLGFQDQMLTEGEAFHFWAIEGPPEVEAELPLHRAGLNVVFTADLQPYRERKVRILNGAHTSLVAVGYLAGLDTVGACMKDEQMRRFLERLLIEEILPSLEGEPAELEAYAHSVLDRFRNPFIQHQLLSISLNSVAKFRSRILPSILAYHAQFQRLPSSLILTFAGLIHFYQGKRGEQDVPLKDDPANVRFLQNCWAECEMSPEGFEQMATQILGWEAAWGRDLNEIAGLQTALANDLLAIEQQGMRQLLKIHQKK